MSGDTPRALAVRKSLPPRGTSGERSASDTAPRWGVWARVSERILARSPSPPRPAACFGHGKFRHRLVKFREAVASQPPYAGNVSVFGVLASIGTGPPLARCWVERSVFRAAVLFIVLTLAGGPNATLLCAVWCHPEEARTSSCQHPGAITSPSVTGGDSCGAVAGTLTALARDDAKRGQPAPQTAPVPGFALAPSRAAATRSSRPLTALGVTTPPLLTALRI